MTESNNGKTLSVGKKILVIFSIAVCVGCLGFIGYQIFYVLGLNTYFVGNDFCNIDYPLAADVDGVAAEISDTALSQIKALPRVYVIPTDQYEAPEPIAENYDKSFSSYSDETITAEYSNKKYYGSLFHFIEITIANPSQLRMALAGNKYGSDVNYPLKIAKKVNAVAAIDGSFYNNRKIGVLIYKREICRMKPSGLDVLMIDSDGDLHVVKDRDIESSGVLEQYDIVSALTFGPALVLNGETQKITAYTWQPSTLEPRAAIAQIDKLHYLICTVDGRQDHSAGVTMQQFANVLGKMGCQTAYNLDGGQSATLILGNHVKNSVAYGGQRRLGDILYFATALDDNDDN